jgi:hypothetical protein
VAKNEQDWLWGDPWWGVETTYKCNKTFYKIFDEMLPYQEAMCALGICYP